MSILDIIKERQQEAEALKGKLNFLNVQSTVTWTPAKNIDKIRDILANQMSDATYETIVVNGNLVYFDKSNSAQATHLVHVACSKGATAVSHQIEDGRWVTELNVMN
jgi:hypothetical protein